MGPLVAIVENGSFGDNNGNGVFWQQLWGCGLLVIVGGMILVPVGGISFFW